MPLTQKELNELRVIEDPNVQYLAPSGGILALLVSHKDKNIRVTRIIELRTKLRMDELGFDQKQNPGKFTALKEEEELRLLEDPRYAAMVNNKKRRERIVELRTKARIEQLGIDPDSDWQKYYQIKQEEEESYNQKFSSNKK